jgi:alpha-tubulin suppressor-like RCC1 family protein
MSDTSKLKLNIPDFCWKFNSVLSYFFWILYDRVSVQPVQLDLSYVRLSVVQYSTAWGHNLCLTEQGKAYSSWQGNEYTLLVAC